MVVGEDHVGWVVPPHDPGSLAEAVFVHFGVWHYTNPTLLGVPLWFPLAFGTAALIGERLVRTITEMWEEVSFSRASKG